jgi:hypothetical protein
VKRDRRTMAEAWMDLERHLKALWLAVLHSLGLHTRQELDIQRRQADWARSEQRRAEASKREAERLLVLLSEPLKDWDLADFDGLATIGSTEARRHLDAIVSAYRLTASAVAPLRMNRVTSDQAHRRGWDDQPLHAPCRSTLDPKRLP